MKLSLSVSELKKYVAAQLGTFFPDKYQFDGADVDAALEIALQRMEYCFKFINQPYYNVDGDANFNHLHTDQYSAFLYFLSNSLWKQSQNKPLCDKLFMLNRTLNAIFVSYKCKLPDIFVFDHAVGTVIGNAEYSDFLVILQNVTINTGDHTGVWLPPKLGKGVFLGAGCKIIGSGNKIGDLSTIGVNSVIYDKDIPNNSIVFTDMEGKLNIRQNKKKSYTQMYFNVDLEKEINKSFIT